MFELCYGIQTLSCGIRDLVPWLGIKSRSPALGAKSLSHWTTREVPRWTLLMGKEGQRSGTVKMTENHSNISLTPQPAVGKWQVGQGCDPHHTDEETEAQRGRDLPLAAQRSVTGPRVTPVSPDSSTLLPDPQPSGVHRTENALTPAVSKGDPQGQFYPPSHLAEEENVALRHKVWKCCKGHRQAMVKCRLGAAGSSAEGQRREEGKSRQGFAWVLSSPVTVIDNHIFEAEPETGCRFPFGGRVPQMAMFHQIHRNTMREQCCWGLECRLWGQTGSFLPVWLQMPGLTSLGLCSEDRWGAQ